MDMLNAKDLKLYEQVDWQEEGPSSVSVQVTHAKVKV
jgi:hypothetical protein